MSVFFFLIYRGEVLKAHSLYPLGFNCFPQDKRTGCKIGTFCSRSPQKHETGSAGGPFCSRFPCFWNTHRIPWEIQLMADGLIALSLSVKGDGLLPQGIRIFNRCTHMLLQ